MGLPHGQVPSDEEARHDAAVSAATLDPLASRLHSALRTLYVAPSTLAYSQNGQRDLRIDLLRGFAVFAMVVDHLAGWSVLSTVTGGDRFFTSAAEGFVCISGLMVGVVYGAMWDRGAPGKAVRRLLERSGQLCMLAVGLALVMIPIAGFLHLPEAQGIDLSDPVGLVLRIVTLHQTYDLVDILLLYAFLLLVAPVALLLLCTGRAWMVLAVSLTLWGAYQISPDRTELPWAIADNQVFKFSSWQVLFFTAMVVGYHRDRFQPIIGRIGARRLLLLSGAGFGVLLLLSQLTYPILHAAGDGEPLALSATMPFSPELIASLFSKESVGPGRLVASIVVFTFTYLLVTELWRPLHRFVGWLLLPLGQNALYAYSVHVVLIMTLGVLSVVPGVYPPQTGKVNAVVQIAAIGIIWLAIRYGVRKPRSSNHRL